jgi:hypothetical protein
MVFFYFGYIYILYLQLYKSDVMHVNENDSDTF